MRPSLSTAGVTWVLLLCLGAAALVVPFAAHLPRWIEFELVLGTWWLVWWIVMSWVLFHRFELEDDADRPEKGHLRSTLENEDFIGSGCLLAEGCGTVEWIAVGLGLILGVFILLEFLIPVIAYGLYLAVRGMLGQAARFHERCEGRAGPSLGWAAVWATTYLAPIGGLIWAVQFAVQQH